MPLRTVACALSLPPLKLRTVEHRCLLSTNCRQPTIALRPLDLVMTQRLFIGMRDKGHLVVECCTKTALSDDNPRDLTACYSPKQKPLSESFPNALRQCMYEARKAINIQTNVLWMWSSYNPPPAQPPTHLHTVPLHDVYLFLHFRTSNRVDIDLIQPKLWSETHNLVGLHIFTRFKIQNSGFCPLYGSRMIVTTVLISQTTRNK
jgi:hypothetical protein